LTTPIPTFRNGPIPKHSVAHSTQSEIEREKERERKREREKERGRQREREKERETERKREREREIERIVMPLPVATQPTSTHALATCPLLCAKQATGIARPSMDTFINGRGHKHALTGAPDRHIRSQLHA
jgi:hypothetical protein